MTLHLGSISTGLMSSKRYQFTSAVYLHSMVCLQSAVCLHSAVYLHSAFCWYSAVWLHSEYMKNRFVFRVFRGIPVFCCVRRITSVMYHDRLWKNVSSFCLALKEIFVCLFILRDFRILDQISFLGRMYSYHILWRFLNFRYCIFSECFRPEDTLCFIS